MTAILATALAAAVALAIRQYRRLADMRAQLREVTRATMREVAAKHSAGVRGWKTRRARA